MEHPAGRWKTDGLAAVPPRGAVDLAGVRVIQLFLTVSNGHSNVHF